MKGSSGVIMGKTLATVILFAFVLVLVLVLLAELYCSLLLRRKNLKAGKPSSNPESSSISEAQDQQSLPYPLSTFYAQGVLEAPRSFLFPKFPSRKRDETERRKNDHAEDVEKQKHGKLHQLLGIQSLNHFALTLPSSSSSSSPPPTFISVSKPPHQSQSNPKPETKTETQVEVLYADEASRHSAGGKGESLMYISNPIYDNYMTGISRVGTPFEISGSSPTRLERNGSSREEEREKAAAAAAAAAPSSRLSLPLSPMKNLPAEASSVEMQNVGSNVVGVLGSESNNSHIGRSSTSSGTTCTSPSW